jgi:hypothetical protein
MESKSLDNILAEVSQKVNTATKTPGYYVLKYLAAESKRGNLDKDILKTLIKVLVDNWDDFESKEKGLLKEVISKQDLKKCEVSAGVIALVGNLAKFIEKELVVEGGSYEKDYRSLKALQAMSSITGG